MRLDELFRIELSEDGLIVPGVNTTQDVQPGETARQAKKHGNVVNDGGIPPTLQSNGKFAPPKST